MDKTKVDTFILTNRDCFLDDDIPMIRQRMESADESKWQALSTLNFKDPQTALMLSIFGGPIGIDRFYIGDYYSAYLRLLPVVESSFGLSLTSF